jgi:hypothetical protein
MSGMTDDERDIASKDTPSEEAAENPLHRKLGIRPGLTGAVVAPPEDDLLSPLPETFVALASFDELASSEGLFDYLHFFARNRGDLVRDFNVSGTSWLPKPLDLLDKAILSSRRRRAAGRSEREHHTPVGVGGRAGRREGRLARRGVVGSQAGLAPALAGRPQDRACPERGAARAA